MKGVNRKPYKTEYMQPLKIKKVKRLKLEAFKAKKLKKEATKKVDHLVGQVLGDCHDDPDVPLWMLLPKWNGQIP